MTHEFVPGDRVVWQTDRALSYFCDECRCWVKTQNEDPRVQPRRIVCHGLFAGHTVEWGADDATRRA